MEGRGHEGLMPVPCFSNPESGTEFAKNRFKHLVGNEQPGRDLLGECLSHLLPYSLSFSSLCCWMLLPWLRNCSGISIQKSKGLFHISSNYIVVLKVKWRLGVSGAKEY